MATIPFFDPVEYLVLRKYPAALQIRAAYGRPLVSAYANPSGFTPVPTETEIKRMHDEIEQYTAELSKKTMQELEVLVTEEQRKEKEAQLKKRFYNQPDANPDYDFWSRAAHWTLEEAVALTFGKNPEVVSWDKLQHCLYDEFTVNYRKLRELAKRAKAWEKLYDPILPSIYISWTKQNQIDFPKGLEDLIIARGNHIVNWPEHYKKLREEHSVNVAALEEVPEPDNGRRAAGTRHRPEDICHAGRIPKSPVCYANQYRY